MDKKNKTFSDLKNLLVVDSVVELVDESKKLRKMIYRIAHDLNSPLAALSLIMKFHGNEIPNFIAERISDVIASFNSILKTITTEDVKNLN